MVLNDKISFSNWKRQSCGAGTAVALMVGDGLGVDGMGVWRSVRTVRGD
jgi:hypothetical protein